MSLQPDAKPLVTAAYANASFQGTLQVYRLAPDGGVDIGPMTLQQGGLVQFPVSGNVSKVVVQASVNLTDWNNLSTNPVSNNAVNFSDPEVATTLARFYRLLIGN